MIYSFQDGDAVAMVHLAVALHPDVREWFHWNTSPPEQRAAAGDSQSSGWETMKYLIYSETRFETAAAVLLVLALVIVHRECHSYWLSADEETFPVPLNRDFHRDTLPVVVLLLDRGGCDPIPIPPKWSTRCCQSRGC